MFVCWYFLMDMVLKSRSKSLLNYYELSVLYLEIYLIICTLFFNHFCLLCLLSLFDQQGTESDRDLGVCPHWSVHFSRSNPKGITHCINTSFLCCTLLPLLNEHYNQDFRNPSFIFKQWLCLVSSFVYGCSRYFPITLQPVKSLTTFVSSFFPHSSSPCLCCMVSSFTWVWLHSVGYRYKIHQVSVINKT